MLISKDNGKSFILELSNPKENWYVLDDNSELAEKYKKYYPHQKLIINKDGEIEDIIDESEDEETIKEKISLLDKELKEIDNQGVTRHLENQIEASETYEIIHINTKNLIDKKNELRAEREQLTKELQELTKVGE